MAQNGMSRTCWFCVHLEGRSDRSDRRPVETYGPRNRVLRCRCTAWDVPTIIPACGPPSSLSPENSTRSAPDAIVCCTPGSFLSHERVPIPEPRCFLVDETAADVGDEGDPVRCLREFGQPAIGGLLLEPLYPVVRWVHLEDRIDRMPATAS